MVYDVAEVRGQYVSLGDGWTYLNAHHRPQIPERVAAGVARAFRTSAAPLPPTTGRVGSHTRTTGGGFEGELHLTAARLAVADLVGSSPEKVVLGSSLEQLYATLARAMRPMWRRGSGVLLTNLDRPELSHQLAAATDHVRWAQPDLGTGELPAYQYERLVEPGTRLVSLPAAHELLGTVTPVAEIVDAAHRAARLWVLVDATTYAAYRPVDMGEWGADIVGVDLERLGGPQLAALVFRDELMLRRLDPVDPAAGRGTNRSLEFPVSEGLAGGVAPLVDHLAALARPEGPGASAGGGSGARGGAGGPRRDRLVRSATEMAAYLRSLSRDLVTFIGSLPAVHILGVTGEVAQGSRVDRVPRISFAVRGVPAETVHRRLLDNGLVTTVAPTGGLLSDMGADEVGGAVTVSLAPFNQSHDIEHLTRVVASLA